MVGGGVEEGSDGNEDFFAVGGEGEDGVEGEEDLVGRGVSGGRKELKKKKQRGKYLQFHYVPFRNKETDSFH